MIMWLSLLTGVLGVAGAVIGWMAGGTLGMAVGVTAASVLGLFAGERLGAGRSAAGFWLRQRAELLALAAAAMGMLVGYHKTGSHWGGLILGYIGGRVAGGWVAEWLGWAGAARDTELAARGGYVEVLASVAVSDGTVTAKERTVIDGAAARILGQMGFGDAGDVDAALEAGHPVPPEHAGAYFRGLPEETRIALLFDLLSVAHADGVASARTKEWLKAFQDGAGLESGAWSEMIRLFDRAYAAELEAKAAGVGTEADALAELGLTAGASEAEIRTAYRAKAEEYHPDRHQGLPEHIRALSAAKMAAISNAYARLTGRGDGGSRRGGDFTALNGVDLVFAPSGRDGSGVGPFSPPDGADFTCACPVCGRTNRVPPKADRSSARCGYCHALPGTERERLDAGRQ